MAEEFGSAVAGSTCGKKVPGSVEENLLTDVMQYQGFQVKNLNHQGH